jgi:hypothetical protein
MRNKANKTKTPKTNQEVPVIDLPDIKVRKAEGSQAVDIVAGVASVLFAVFEGCFALVGAVDCADGHSLCGLGAGIFVVGAIVLSAPIFLVIAIRMVRRLDALQKENSVYQSALGYLSLGLQLLTNILLFVFSLLDSQFRIVVNMGESTGLLVFAVAEFMIAAVGICGLIRARIGKTVNISGRGLFWLRQIMSIIGLGVLACIVVVVLLLQ